MTRSRLPRWLFGIGLGLWLPAVAWSLLVSPRSFYSEADEQAYQEAAVQLQRLANRQPLGDDRPAEEATHADERAAIEDAQADYARAAAKRRTAQWFGRTLPRAARWLGTFVALGGLLLHLRRRNSG